MFVIEYNYWNVISMVAALTSVSLLHIDLIHGSKLLVDECLSSQDVKMGGKPDGGKGGRVKKWVICR